MSIGRDNTSISRKYFGNVKRIRTIVHFNIAIHFCSKPILRPYVHLPFLDSYDSCEEYPMTTEVSDVEEDSSSRRRKKKLYQDFITGKHIDESQP